MPELVEIGPCNFPAHAEGILAIERVSFPTPWSLDAFRAEAEKPFSNLWVLADDGEVSGYICFWLLASEIQLINLAVHPERRGNRLARFLLSRMIKKGVINGVKSVWLEVRPSNTGARHLYKKMGFIDAGIRPNYYSETKEDAITMSLSLSDPENSIRPDHTD